VRRLGSDAATGRKHPVPNPNRSPPEANVPGYGACRVAREGEQSQVLLSLVAFKKKTQKTQKTP